MITIDENDYEPLKLSKNKLFSIFRSEVSYHSLEGSLFVASVTDFDHALPIWYPVAQLPLDPHIEKLPALIRTQRLFRHRMFPSRFH